MLMKACCTASLALAARPSTAFIAGPAVRGVLRPGISTRGISSTALRMVAVGDIAPDFTLTDQNGEAVSLSSVREEEKSIVVFFYPKDNTPGCTKEAQAFNADLAKFSELGAEVLGISSDEDHSDFVSKYGLKMKLLSDVGGKVRKAWKVKGAMFGAIDGRVTYVIDKAGVVTKMYDNLLDGAAHSKEALEALKG